MTAMIAIRTEMSVKIVYKCGCVYETIIEVGDELVTTPLKCEEHDSEIKTILKECKELPIFPEGTEITKPNS